ncbi:MAG: hypothetical protein KJ077_25740 [Anaerolineae bacterium]|nr:hypothetical protein [Anaerolineae bacterium]GIK38013.1 MAG: hypothetical protein BroJett011_18460 [Chloroflexota bacterium]
MTVRVTVKEYLEKLEKEESTKPVMQRKPIPTPAAMAEAAGVTRQTMYNFLSRDNHQRVDLDLLNSIITQLRRYGHKTQLTDVLKYIED